MRRGLSKVMRGTNSLKVNQATMRSIISEALEYELGDNLQVTDVKHDSVGYGFEIRIEEKAEDPEVRVHDVVKS